MSNARTLTARMNVVESDIAAMKGDLALILAAVTGSQPAMVVTPAPAEPKAPKAKDEEFVTWLRETAEQRKARKSSNREMAAWLREKGLPTNGPVWEAAKAGERKMTVLRKLAKAQA